MALWNFRVLPAHIEIGLLLIPSLSPLQPGCYHGPCEVLRITETPICSTDAGIIIKNFFFFWQLSLWIQPPQFPPNSVLLPINCLSRSHETPVLSAWVSWKWLWAERYSERWGIGVLLRPLPFSMDVSKSVLVSGLFISFERLDRSWHFETGNRSKICACFPLPQCSHLDSSVGRAITNPRKASGPSERLVQVFESKWNKRKSLCHCLAIQSRLYHS